MCVGFWTLEHPAYALYVLLKHLVILGGELKWRLCRWHTRILCSNRDEFLSRPTTPAHWHSFGPSGTDDHGEGDVLSGRDLAAGGTWAGVSRTGRFALLCVIPRVFPWVLPNSRLS